MRIKRTGGSLSLSENEMDSDLEIELGIKRKREKSRSLTQTPISDPMTTPSSDQSDSFSRGIAVADAASTIEDLPSDNDPKANS